MSLTGQLQQQLVNEVQVVLGHVGKAVTNYTIPAQVNDGL